MAALGFLIAVARCKEEFFYFLIRPRSYAPPFCFGMGIDKTNVTMGDSIIICPRTIEGYYQEDRSSVGTDAGQALLFHMFNGDVIQLQRIASGAANEGGTVAKLE